MKKVFEAIGFAITLPGAQQMLRKSISCVLASLIIVVAVTMFVMEPRKAIGVAAAFCLFAGFLWLYDALLGLRRS
jgi:hypothetical protein